MIERRNQSVKQPTYRPEGSSKMEVRDARHSTIRNVNRNYHIGSFHKKVLAPLHPCYLPINPAINSSIHLSVRPSIHPCIHPSSTDQPINTCPCSPVFRREYLTWKQFTTLQNRSSSGSTGLSEPSSSVPFAN